MTVTTAFDYFREALSEFMATAAFVFLMCGTGLSTRNPTNTYGIDLTAHFAFVIYCFGNVRFGEIVNEFPSRMRLTLPGHVELFIHILVCLYRPDPCAAGRTSTRLCRRACG